MASSIQCAVKEEARDVKQYTMVDFLRAMDTYFIVTLENLQMCIGKECLMDVSITYNCLAIKLIDVDSKKLYTTEKIWLYEPSSLDIDPNITRVYSFKEMKHLIDLHNKMEHL